MKKKVYINGIASINAQVKSSESTRLFEEVQRYDNSILEVKFSDFKKYIAPAAMRRMSKSVKMGITTAHQALDDANLKMPTAIITGTGMGCKQDSDIFLEQMLANHETLLTPTKFIQSTHNTVGGQIALNLKCNAYNFTYVQGGSSFESALLDAQLIAENSDKEEQILVGGVDEISKNSIGLQQLDGQLKKEKNIHNLDLLNYKTVGSIAGEGASFFLIENKKTEVTYASLKDLAIFNNINEDETASLIENFLTKNQLTMEEIDVVILGNNGDITYDNYYTKLQSGIFKHTLQAYYKHLIGEYYTASGFALWMGSKILKDQQISEVCLLNEKEKPATFKNILLYNQYRGKNHSFILLQAC